MPMGGGGTRFGNYGFNVPKPLINLQGKPFFYWAVQSVNKFIEVQDIIFVVLKEHVGRNVTFQNTSTCKPKYLEG